MKLFVLLRRRELRCCRVVYLDGATSAPRLLLHQQDAGDCDEADGAQDEPAPHRDDRCQQEGIDLLTTRDVCLTHREVAHREQVRHHHRNDEQLPAEWHALQRTNHEDQEQHERTQDEPEQVENFRPVGVRRDRQVLEPPERSHEPALHPAEPLSVQEAHGFGVPGEADGGDLLNGQSTTERLHRQPAIVRVVDGPPEEGFLQVGFACLEAQLGAVERQATTVDRDPMEDVLSRPRVQLPLDVEQIAETSQEVPAGVVAQVDATDRPDLGVVERNDALFDGLIVEDGVGVGRDDDVSPDLTGRNQPEQLVETSDLRFALALVDGVLQPDELDALVSEQSSQFGLDFFVVLGLLHQLSVGGRNHDG